MLVTGEGEDKQATLEVAHETVLTGWERLHQWILEHAEALRARRDLERIATEWDKSGRQRAALRTGKLLQRYISAAKPFSLIASEYVAACERHRIILRSTYVVLGIILVVLASILFQINNSDYPPSLTAKAFFVDLGLWPIQEQTMVKIPAGEFKMGDISNVGFGAEQPVHTVRFDTAFEMSKYEVTFDEYDLFAAATGRKKPTDKGWGRGHLPVINVSWIDAVSYAQWLSKHTGMHYRLPSEAEWEYAARAMTQTIRYWPDNSADEQDVSCTYANIYAENNEILVKKSIDVNTVTFNCADDYPFTAPGGQFSANKWGLHDMLGNVWEWTQDCYIKNYIDAPVDGSPIESTGDLDCTYRVLRGGSWKSVPDVVSSAFRSRGSPNNEDHENGFRLVRAGKL